MSTVSQTGPEDQNLTWARNAPAARRPGVERLPQQRTPQGRENTKLFDDIHAIQTRSRPDPVDTDQSLPQWAYSLFNPSGA